MHRTPPQPTAGSSRGNFQPIPDECHATRFDRIDPGATPLSRICEPLQSIAAEYLAAHRKAFGANAPFRSGLSPADIHVLTAVAAALD